MTAILKLSLLGSPEIWLDDEPVTAFKTGKARALLFYLALTKQTHSRHALAGLLWGDDAEEKAKNSLRVALANLNQLFPHHLNVARQTVAFNIESVYWLDVEQFDAQTQALAVHDATEQIIDITTLQQTAELYRGPLLADFQMAGAPDFIEWLLPVRERLRQSALEVLATLARAYLNERTYAQAIPILTQLLTAEPLHEAAYRDMMLAHARLGEFDAALISYDTCCRLLDEKFGIAPMPETAILYQRIKRAQANPSNSLPVDDAPFVGRDIELAQVDNMLHNPDSRLLTITGFGGMGKTRLALEAAARANQDDTREFLNGVVYLSLVDVDSPDLLPYVIAEALGIKLAGQSSPTAQLLAYLRDKELLLVLDNLEHLMDGIDLVSDILQGCPDVKIMVTSREPLYLAAEWRLGLEGLAYPAEAHSVYTDAAAEANTATASETPLVAYEAVQFLVQVASAVKPAFRVTAENGPAIHQFCHLTAGSPLAIKLAILWLDRMSLPEIVAEIARNLDILATDLPDWPQRQRSMKAIFDHTYTLLDPMEQQAFQRISVFRGGFMDEAAMAVADASFYLLTGLVDRGLLQLEMTAQGIRYKIHELTRQYAAQQLTAAQQLAAADAVDMPNRHSRYYATYAYERQQHIYGPHYKMTLHEIEAELNNIRAAWAWLTSLAQDPQAIAAVLEMLQQFTPVLAFYFQIKTLYSEAHRTFQQMTQALELAGWDSDDNPLADQQRMAVAQMRVQVASFNFDLGNFEAVEALMTSVIAFLRDADAQWELAQALSLLGRAHARRGHRADASQALEESIIYAKEVGAQAEHSRALNGLAMIASAQGDYAEARRIYGDALQIYEEMDYAPGKVMLLSNIGSTYGRAGQHAEGLAIYEQALAIAEPEVVGATLMVIISNMGSVLRGLKRYQESETHYIRSLAMARSMANQRWVAANLHGIGRLYIEMNDLGAAARALNEGFDVAYRIQSAPDALGDLSLLAHVWAQRGKVEEALRVLLFVEHHPSSMARDKAYSAEFLQELQSELPPPIVEGAQAWVATQSLDDVAAWVHESIRSELVT